MLVGGRRRRTWWGVADLARAARAEVVSEALEEMVGGRWVDMVENNKTALKSFIFVVLCFYSFSTNLAYICLG